MNKKHILLIFSVITTTLSAMKDTKHESGLRNRRGLFAFSAAASIQGVVQEQERAAVETERALILTAAFNELSNKKTKVTTDQMQRIPLVVQQRIAEFYPLSESYKRALLHLVNPRAPLSRLCDGPWLKTAQEELSAQYNKWRAHVPAGFERCIVGYRVRQGNDIKTIVAHDFELARCQEYPIERLYALPKNVALPCDANAPARYGVVLYSDGSQERSLEISSVYSTFHQGHELACHLYNITHTRPKVVVREKGKTNKEDVCCPLLLNNCLQKVYLILTDECKKNVQKNYPFVFTDAKEMAKLQKEQAELALQDTTISKRERIEQAAHWLRIEPTCLSAKLLQRFYVSPLQRVAVKCDNGSRKVAEFCKELCCDEDCLGGKLIVLGVGVTIGQCCRYCVVPLIP